MPRLWPVIGLLCSLLLLPSTPVVAQSSQRCFPETNNCISGPIREYWERNGGLAIFGFPIAAQTQEAVEGVNLQVQWFERDRLEIQPDGRVTTGRLGVERLAQLGTPWQFGPNAPPGAGCRTFTETGHTVCGAMLRYWDSNGGVNRLGFPVTGEQQAVIEGKTLTVQYFERRRMEYHPENAGTPYEILLGLLGREVLSQRGGVPQPPPPPAPTPTPAPPAPTYNDCRNEPNPGAAPNFPIRITAINKSAETVTLKNQSDQAIDLAGWRMCSIRGNQLHSIGGVLNAGEERTFRHDGGNIWNNMEDDDGALYDPAGRLISYWND